MTTVVEQQQHARTRARKVICMAFTCGVSFQYTKHNPQNARAAHTHACTRASEERQDGNRQRAGTQFTSFIPAIVFALLACRPIRQVYSERLLGLPENMPEGLILIISSD